MRGTDGSGRATQSKLPLKRLQREGVDCVKLDCPRYGEPSAAPVEAYLRARREAGEKPVADYGWQYVRCASDGEMRGVEDIHEGIYWRMESFCGLSR